MKLRLAKVFKNLGEKGKCTLPFNYVMFDFGISLRILKMNFSYVAFY